MYDKTSFYNQTITIQQHFISISLRDSYVGVKKYINVNNELVPIQIPRGLMNGTRLIETINGIKIVCIIIISEDVNVIQRNSLDLEITQNINLITSIKGGKINVKLWDINIGDVNIPAGIKTNSYIRIKNKGLYSDKIKMQGDLYLKINVLPLNYNDLNEECKKTIDLLEQQLKEINA